MARGGLAVLVAAAALAAPAHGQQLNPRKAAPPSAESKKSRLVARAELQARRDQGSSLKSDQLTVSKSCGNVQVGDGGASSQGPRRTADGLLQQDKAVVVQNVVNICR